MYIARHEQFYQLEKSPKMENKTTLKSNTTDHLVSVAKSVLGAVPVAGSLLTELIGVIIPNQRIDRLTKYIKELDSKLSQLPTDKLISLAQNEDLIDLVEEGFTQASRAITDERRSYIASIVANGIKEDKIKFHESKYLLKLLQELNDIEIIWLRSYLVITKEGDDEFRSKHENILRPASATVGSNEDTLRNAALQRSYKEHLERLDLIQPKIHVDRKTGLPQFDTTTGRPKVSFSSLTTLGKILLTQIGLIDELGYNL